ncbi:MAG: UvrD-helicase domain-containing protein [Endomicrobium sp.]|jgi:DNA helicase-2/ATP-dependent DNA helicase PcrA|nr:UvrD-helicase domain-containing protein [Endomicrobium sp.]
MNNLTENLNQSQKEAALCINSPLIIFAGAGTGKTRVITHRIAYLLSQGVAAWKILAVTFTNKAAAEMRKRVNDLAAGAAADVHISTFHSFCAYFLRIEASNINLSPEFVIYDFGEQKNVVKDCIKELNLDEKKFKPSYVTDRISRAKDDLKTHEDLAKDASALGDFFSASISNIYALYQRKLKTAQALDFGDLILTTVFALQQHPEILEKYRAKFKYIMVDEYQDTNRAQYVLTKLLAGNDNNICVVGDDDQSVYGWRGADVNNILDFEKDYPNAKTVKLEQNYRSTPKILETAYNVVKNNARRIEKKLWTQNPDDGSLSLIKSKNENDEAAKVADIIFLNSQNGKFNLSDFAVFYRTNAQSRVLEDSFRRAGIPYSVVGTLRFYDRAEIKDITAYLKLIHNPNDNVSLKRIINVPRRAIGKTSLENLERIASERNISIWRAIEFAQEELNKGTLKALNEFASLINSFINLKKSETVKTIAENVILRSGYLKELELENSPESKTKIENIQELISAIDDFEKRSPDRTLAGYLTQTALISDLDLLDDSKGKVTMMTLHLAKGLEFDNVFITGLEEGLFPVGESAFKPEELEEERRLMYVGMTRARKNLFLTWASERTVYGKTKWNMLSRFASEAGFKDEFSDARSQKENMYFKNNYYSKSGLNGARSEAGKFQGYAKAQYKYKTEDSYDYIPSDDEVIKDEPLYVPTADLSPYKIGDFVIHPVFGKGKITEKSGKGDDVKLIILFDNGQWKKLLAKVSNLKIIA